MSVPPQMLAVELKKTETVDFVTPLRQYIQRNHGESIPPEDYNDALSQLQALRVAAISAERHEGGLDALWRYYAQLVSLEARFPFDETNISIEFPWKDSFRGKRYAERSLVYERACILFNIATLNAQLGCVQNRSDVEGIKKACAFFQAAAGALSFLRDTVFSHLRSCPSQDLSPDCLTLLVNLNLAQGQECVYEKATRDGKGATVLAKVAAQVAEYYESAYALASSSVLSTNFHKTWLTHLQMRALVFRGLSQYHGSEEYLASLQYGENIARLQRADELLTQAKALIKGAPTDIVDFVTRVSARVAATKTQAVRDNDTAYCQPVPPFVNLPEIGKVSLVKPTPVPSEAVDGCAPNTDLFVKVVPFHITQALSVFTERQATLIRSETARADEATHLAHSLLASLNLPSAIEALKAPVGLPPSLVSQSREVRSEGGTVALEDLAATLQAIAAKDQQILDQATAALDAEEAEDDACKSQLGGKWNRSPSRTLTRSVREEASKYRATLEQARSADAILMAKLTEHRQGLELLALDEGALAGLLPSTKASALAESPVTAALEGKLRNLQVLLTARTSLVQELKGLNGEGSVAARLLSEGKAVASDEIFASELAKFEPLQAQLTQSIADQAAAMEAIKEANAKFTALRSPDDAVSQREAFLSHLTAAHRAWIEVKTGLADGITFYTNFQDIVQRLSNKCSDFAFARKTEKSDMLTRLQAASVGVTPLSTTPMGAFTVGPSGYYSPTAAAASGGATFVGGSGSGSGSGSSSSMGGGGGGGGGGSSSSGGYGPPSGPPPMSMGGGLSGPPPTYVYGGGAASGPQGLGGPPPTYVYGGSGGGGGAGMSAGGYGPPPTGPQPSLLNPFSPTAAGGGVGGGVTSYGGGGGGGGGGSGGYGGGGPPAASLPSAASMPSAAGYASYGGGQGYGGGTAPPYQQAQQPQQPQAATYSSGAGWSGAPPRGPQPGGPQGWR